MANAGFAAVISSGQIPVFAKQKLSPRQNRSRVVLFGLTRFLLPFNASCTRADSLEDAAKALARKVCAPPRQPSLDVHWENPETDGQPIANVLLQRQAEPASTLLPQWLSGYALLFSVETNLERAKEIPGGLPVSAATERHLAHVWLEPPDLGAGQPPNARPKRIPRLTRPAASAGAKP